jgi:hypothetical protein
VALARLLLIATLAAGLPVPAGAVNLPPAAEQVLWCASAFNWLARDADDVGDAVGAEILDAWTDLFTERAMAELRAAGLGDAAVEEAIAVSDLAVLGEMQEKTMRYDVESCPELERE